MYEQLTSRVSYSSFMDCPFVVFYYVLFSFVPTGTNISINIGISYRLLGVQ